MAGFLNLSRVRNVKEKKKSVSILMVIAGLFFTLLFADRPLSGTEIPKTMFLANPLTCSASEGNEVRLSKQDNGKEITVKVGDIIRLELERFGSTGYEWHLDKSFKAKIELTREETKGISGKGLVGTPVLRSWKLRAVKKGETNLTLHLYRDWEGLEKAVESFSIKIKIL